MEESTKSKGRRIASPQCLDLQSWRAPSPQEHRQFYEDIQARRKTVKKHKPSGLAVRKHLTPVDLYCYLKARFGEPNGFQSNVLRNEKTSDNWIHWDYLLKAGDENVYVSGTSRECHFTLSEKLTDENWRDLIQAIKADYGRVGKSKSAVLKSLERWVTFPNKFSQIANVCADHHAAILDNMEGFRVFKISSQTNKTATARFSVAKQLGKRSDNLYKHCLELSLLTPVMAEAFLNMVILILCKPEIRSNKRHFEAFIRSQIDTKLFDMAHKCHGFARPIDPNSESFKDFKRVMDKRNNAIHGNCDPEGEKIEMVYFEGTRPLFVEAGDHVGKLFEALERQYEPKRVVRDYENTHRFLLDILACVEPELAKSVRIIVDDPYPAYDIDRKIVGAVLPHDVVVGALRGLRYDDELAIVWS